MSNMTPRPRDGYQLPVSAEVDCALSQVGPHRQALQCSRWRREVACRQPPTSNGVMASVGWTPVHEVPLARTRS